MKYLFRFINEPPRGKWIFLLFIFQSLGIFLVRGQSLTINKHVNHVSIPFKIVRGLIIIQVYINGKGPFNFILDTGVGIMTITEPEIVDAVHIVKRRALKLTGLGTGPDFETFITDPLKIDIGDLNGANINAAIFEKDYFGISNYAGIPICGLLGYEFFDKLAVRINLNDSTLTCFKPQYLHVKKKYIKLPISIQDNKPYMEAFVTFKDGSERNCKLIIDLGAGHPLSLEGTDPCILSSTKLISANLGMGFTGPVNGRIGRIGQLKIGSFVIKDVLTSFPDTNQNIKPRIPRDGNLGFEILKRFNIIIDYPDTLIFLSPRNNFKEAFEHDMSGIEYYSVGGEFRHVVIGRVELGSAADQAGIKKDDELLAVNFKPVNTVTLDDLDQLFRSKEGRKLLLGIYRNKKYENIIITLKRRI